MPSTTLRDVANKAGVSIGTASQALNNRANVSPETRERVLEAAIALGYEIKSRQSIQEETPISVIGMLTKHDYGLEIGVNPFYYNIQVGVESECRRRNLSLMYANIEVDWSNRPVLWPATITAQRVDGLILMGTYIEEAIGMIKRNSTTPVILVDGYSNNFLIDCVNIDNLGGSRAVVNYLIDCGHRHIGLIGTNPNSPPGVLLRRAGYLQALAEHGIQEHYIEDTRLTRADALEGAARLLRRYPQITAIFGANDDTAIGAIHAARDMGYHVPRDLSVVGFDDTDIARAVTPALTTVHVHRPWMGVMAVRLLLERVLNPQQPRVEVLVSTDLVVRDSVAPPANR